ncbi:DUF6933 domain-containing protein [Lampropedia aestuarii]|uniref:DUF6933 domain-containing protein n=1 Tax=Lampropedia aestuarii TaxID=2562762 RepID=UPI003CC82D28
MGGLPSQLLLLRGFSQNLVKKAITPYHTGFFAKTDSRAALGSLNGIVARYQWSVEGNGGLGSCDLTAIIMQTNKAPQRRLGWNSSWNAVEEKLSKLS